MIHKMKYLIILIFINLFCFVINAQEQFGDNVAKTEKVQIKPEYVHQKFDIGFGFGTDYGGLVGAKVVYSPIKYLAIFASGGYYLIGLGWEAGVTGYVLPRTTQRVFRPYAKVMYGANRVIEVDGASQYNKIYSGFTPGIGIEFRFGKIKKHGMNLDVNYPISSSKFKEDYDSLKHNPLIDIGPIQPVTISFGYHFVLF